jgi:hypothetical protein
MVQSHACCSALWQDTETSKELVQFFDRVWNIFEREQISENPRAKNPLRRAGRAALNNPRMRLARGDGSA